MYLSICLLTPHHPGFPVAKLWAKSGESLGAACYLYLMVTQNVLRTHQENLCFRCEAPLWTCWPLVTMSVTPSVSHDCNISKILAYNSKIKLCTQDLIITEYMCLFFGCTKKGYLVLYISWGEVKSSQNASWAVYVKI